MVINLQLQILRRGDHPSLSLKINLIAIPIISEKFLRDDCFFSLQSGMPK